MIPSLFSSSAQHVLLGRFCGIDGRWPYNCCFVRCWFHDFFKTARQEDQLKRKKTISHNGEFIGKKTKNKTE